MLKLSLGVQVLLAVLLGILAGVFFGPLTLVLKPIGSIYTMLLQMVVLPYICFSLLHGLGSISPAIGKRLFKKGALYLFALWALVLLIIYLVIQLIPDTLAPIIRTNEEQKLESEFTKNFLNYIIPENPLYDIANNVVPAVAIFGIIGGIALMHVEKKEPLLGVLERINQTIEKILNWLALLSPVGAFVYMAIGFGTIYFEDLYKVGLFALAFIFTTLFVTFWLLPILVSCLTPFKYREVLQMFRFVCLVPFVTGLSTAALPFLNMFLRKLYLKHDAEPKFRETSQTVLPIAYSFGNIGNGMILFFIIFLGYYYRHPFSGTEKAFLSFLTVPLSIGSSTTNVNSILFLIQKLGFPTGSSDFFLQIKSVTINFQVLMSIAGVTTLIILILYSYYGFLKIQWRKFATYLIASLAGFTLLVFGVKLFIKPQDLYQNLYMELKLSDVIAKPAPSTFLKEGEVGTVRSFPDPVLPEVMSQIIKSKVLKIGYYADQIPFCYHNDRGEIVGYDIAYAYKLAEDLECRIEFIPLDFNTLGPALMSGAYDIGMGSIIMSERRLFEMGFTFPYYADNNVLVVPVKKQNEFLRYSEVKERKGLRIGGLGAWYHIGQQIFPNAEMVSILTSEEDTFLSGQIDACLWSETIATIWCLNHPEYVVISYGEDLKEHGQTYFSYPFRQHAIDLGFFLNNWLGLKEKSGFKQAMHSYWIDGVRPGERPPRWSILKNVLLPID